jgi:hypothetical protein
MAWASYHQIAKWDTLIDGDDAVIIIERPQSLPQAVQQVRNTYSMFGMEAKTEVCPGKIKAGELEGIEFCRSWPILLAPGKYRMTRAPARAISTLLSSHKHYHEGGHLAARVQLAMASSEYVVSNGIPIMGNCAKQILNVLQAQGVVQLSLAHLEEKYGWLSVTAEQAQKALRRSFVKPNGATRELYYRAFGITPAQQQNLESLFAKTITWESLRVAECPPKLMGSPVGLREYEYTLEPYRRYIHSAPIADVLPQWGI